MRAILWSLAFVAAALPAGAQTAAKAAVSYRINGVATSSRDGAPVPFCVLHLQAAEAAVQVGSGPRSGPPQDWGGRPDGGDRGGGERGGGERGGHHDSYRSRERQAAQDGNATADAQGRFSLEAPGPGAWLLTGMARGFYSQAYEAHEEFASAIVLTAEKPVAQVSFRLAADAMIAGAVLDEAGEPVVGAQVTAEVAGDASGDGRPGVKAFGQTDDRGRYELAALAPGAYRVRVEAKPWYAGSGVRYRGAQEVAQPESSLDPSLDVVYPETWFPGAEEASQAEVVRLSSGEVRQADFHLQVMAAAHLVVPRVAAATGGAGAATDGREWNGPLVSRRGSDGLGQFSTMTGSMRVTSASWEVTGLAPGTYDVRLPGADGHPGMEAEEITVQPGAGTIDLASAKPLLTVEVNFTGAPTGMMDVTLTDAATGRRYSTMGGGRSFGSYERRDDDLPRRRDILVTAGEYEVTVAGSDTAYLAGVSAKGAQMHGDRVVIAGEGASLTLQLANGRAELDGIAALAEKPAAGAMVLLVPATAETKDLADRTARDETNSDGSFELHGVVPGEYILVVVKDGWGTNWRDPATLASLLVHGVPVELKPGARVKLDVQAVRL